MANLGAVCYKAVKAGLYEQWSASMEGDDSAKAEMWRAEGRQAMLESVRAKLVAADILQGQIGQLSIAREADRVRADSRLEYETDLLKKEIATIQQRHSQFLEAEIASRLEETVRKTEERKDNEAAALRLRVSSLVEENATLVMLDALKANKYTGLERELADNVKRIEESRCKFAEELSVRLEEAKDIQKLTIQQEYESEISNLRQRVAAFESQGKLLASKEQTCKLLAEKNEQQEAELGKAHAQLEILRAKNTRSSYAIGKQGEALVMDVLREHVLPMFLYSRAIDVHSIGHSADIHLFLQSPVGKQMKILVESKQYTEPVRIKEITKLHNDVDADDEAQAGIMISTSSSISRVKQFQIEKTPKGKYILYLSVEGFDDELRGRTICWAIRVLSTLTSYSNESDTNIVGKIVDFFKELDKSTQEVDTVVKSCQKTLELATTMKKNLTKRLEDFRVENMANAPLPVETKSKTKTQPASAPKRSKSKKQTARKETIKLINSTLYCVRGSNIYEYDDASSTVGDYVGQLTNDDTIDFGAEESGID